MSLLDTASLIVTPNGYKEGKLYSVIPSDGSGDMSVTRATTATRVNSAGLVELVPYNLFQYSEQFNDAIWVKQSGSSITANTTTAPDGTTTADTLTISSGQYLYQNIGANIGVTYTISIYVKVASGTNQFKFNVFGAGNNFMSSTLTATTTWQRFEYTFTATGTGVTGIYPILVDGLTGGNFFIWGAQAVEGSTALEYFATETRLNIPRLDYSNGSCPSLLVEPQRTNLALRSQEFDNASWVKVNASVTANTTASPDGISNADSLVENTATNLHLTYQFFTSTATTYSYSCYIKPDTRTRAYLRTDTSAGTVRTLFDLTGAGSVVTLAHTSASITAVGNGWYRATITFTEGTGAANRLIAVEGAIGTSISYTGNGLTAFYLYGAQLEAGAYPTSYIPTTSASVTRNDDFISKTSATSLIGQTEGTIFVDFYNDGNTIYNPFSISDGYYGDAIYFEQFLGQMYGVIWDGGSQQFSFNAGALSIGNHRMAIAYKTNDIAFYIDGVLKATDSSATIPTCSRIDVGYLASATVYKTFINAAALWKTRITNAQLAQLTTI